MRKLLAIVYGCWANESFDPPFEKRLKARQVNRAQQEPTQKKGEIEGQPGAERQVAGPRYGSNKKTSNGGTGVAAPVSQRETDKRKRNATLSQKSVSSSERGQSTFRGKKIPEGKSSVNG